jgi:hypothetical protein
MAENTWQLQEAENRFSEPINNFQLDDVQLPSPFLVSLGFKTSSRSL